MILVYAFVSGLGVFVGAVLIDLGFTWPGLTLIGLGIAVAAKAYRATR